MGGVQGFCIIAAAVALIFCGFSDKRWPIFIPVGLLIVAAALGKFAAT